MQPLLLRALAPAVASCAFVSCSWDSRAPKKDADASPAWLAEHRDILSICAVKRSGADKAPPWFLSWTCRAAKKRYKSPLGVQAAAAFLDTCTALEDFRRMAGWAVDVRSGQHERPPPPPRKNPHSLGEAEENTARFVERQLVPAIKAHRLEARCAWFLRIPPKRPHRRTGQP
jgi:hypothetical protein